MDDQELYEAKRALFQSMYECDEHGFIRHVCYCLLTRHHPIHRGSFFRDATIKSIQILRLKRALDRMTPEQLAQVGVVAQNHSTQEGWSTRLDKYDHETMVEGANGYASGSRLRHDNLCLPMVPEMGRPEGG